MNKPLSYFTSYKNQYNAFPVKKINIYPIFNTQNFTDYPKMITSLTKDIDFIVKAPCIVVDLKGVDKEYPDLL